MTKVVTASVSDRRALVTVSAQEHCRPNSSRASDGHNLCKLMSHEVVLILPMKCACIVLLWLCAVFQITAY